MLHKEIYLHKIGNIPNEAFLRASQEHNRLRSKRLKSSLNQSKKLSLINAAYKKDLNRLIGKKNLPTYQKLHKRRIQTMNKLRKAIAKTPEGLLNYEKERLANIKKTGELIDRAKIDKKKLAAIQSTKHKKIQNIFGKAPKVWGPEVEFGKETQGFRKWRVLEEPFQDRHYEILEATSTKGPKSFYCDLECDLWSGRIKHHSGIRFGDASDDESVYIKTIGEVAHVIQMPDGCHTISVFPTFKNLDSWTKGYVVDECGYSECSVANFILATVWVNRIWPSGSGTKQYDSVLRGINGGSGVFKVINGIFTAPGPWDVNLWEPNEAVFSQNIINVEETFNPGDFLGLWVGLDMVYVANLNDYGISSELQYELKVDKVYIQFH